MMNNEMPESGNPRISGACTSRSPLSVFAGQTSATTCHSEPTAKNLEGGAELGAKVGADANLQKVGSCRPLQHYNVAGDVFHPPRRVNRLREYTLKGIRGASWNNDATNLRVSDRNNAGNTNAGRNNNIGFRPASTPNPPSFPFNKGGKEGDLFKRITEFNNILSAFFKAQRAKKEKLDVAKFNFSLERNILKIKDVLEKSSYTPEEYTKFTLYEPKKREIAAPAFIDRVVHHALCNVIAPIFEKQFIRHSYACRSHKGMHKAMVKAQDFLRVNDYYLKCDVKSFFFSIDHNILLKFISRTIKDEKTMWLIEKIVASAPNPGLPIGNLTSQLFANVYLNELDHFIVSSRRIYPAFNTHPEGCGYQPAYDIAHPKGCGCYLRYMDDFVLFSNSKKQLWEWKNLLEKFLNERLKLQLNFSKCFVAPFKEGLDFCGYRVFRDKRRLRPQNVKSFRKRLKKIKKAIAAPKLKAGVKGAGRKMSPQKAYEKIQSWHAHALWANTYNLRKKILGSLNPGYELWGGDVR